MKALQENGGTDCEHNPELFFPDDFDSQMNSYQSDIAKSICRACPLLNECFEYSLALNEPYGIWAGTTPLERRKLLRIK
jgi:WhiB family redox-sensing transcriptional regulator